RSRALGCEAAASVGEASEPPRRRALADGPHEPRPARVAELARHGALRLGQRRRLARPNALLRLLARLLEVDPHHDRLLAPGVRGSRAEGAVDRLTCLDEVG